MRAVVYDRYGPPDVLRIAEVAKPSPKDDEILVRIRAATVNRLDCATREANRRSGLAVSVISRLVFGARRPRRQILGSEFAGDVDAVGISVREFAVGDDVFGITGLSFGTHAEWISVPEKARIAHMPRGMRYEEAAAVCDGALNALACLRQAKLRSGQSILVYGASGSIGTAGVQLAKYFGAHVTAVCKAERAELAKSLGADEVIDYTREDFTKNGRTYDVIFDAVGKLSFKRCKRSLNRSGSYLATDKFENLWLTLWTALVGTKRVRFSITSSLPTKQDVVFLKEMIEAGRYRPVIDRVYPLDDVVEAARYVETERKVGNVVLAVSGAGAAA